MTKNFGETPKESVQSQKIPLQKTAVKPKKEPVKRKIPEIVELSDDEDEVENRNSGKMFLEDSDSDLEDDDDAPVQLNRSRTRRRAAPKKSYVQKIELSDDEESFIDDNETDGSEEYVE